MTTTELINEWRYLYEERLGILCGAGVPTQEQREMAKAEADEAVGREGGGMG